MLEGVVDEALFFVFKIELYHQSCDVGQQHGENLLGYADIEAVLEIFVGDHHVGRHQDDRYGDRKVASEIEPEEQADQSEQDDD